jgi:hypothetical protein
MSATTTCDRCTLIAAAIAAVAFSALYAPRGSGSRIAKRGGVAPASSGGGLGGCGGLGGGLGAGGCGGSRLGWQASTLVAPVTPPV